MTDDFFLGIDFGTSGARAIAIDSTAQIQATSRCDYDQTSPRGRLDDLWRDALFEVLGTIPLTVRRHLRAIAINGTSSTVLWCDAQGHPVESPLLYNDDRGQSVLGILRAIAPPHHLVLSPTSSLAKLLWWSCQSLVNQRDTIDPQRTAPYPLSHHPSETGEFSEQTFPFDIPRQTLPSGYFLHQADWLAFLLHGKLGISDYHNSLKLGFDVEHLHYPPWMERIPTGLTLPRVVAPGTPVGTILPERAARFEVPPSCQVCAGTTDSIAAFLASGVEEPGEAVTSLGSTLVIKLLSTVKVDDARYGIYSHRLDRGDAVYWLVGGASNTGGAVLRQFFSDEALVTLSQQIDPMQASHLDYYPLTKPGERFPVCDRHLRPQLSPRPADDVQFLHGLLESMARIETRGFELLEKLGATPVQSVYTAGGGAKNPAWIAIRQRCLGVPVVPSPQTEAAYGTARLALAGVR